MIQIEFPENSQENTSKKSEAKSKNLSKEKQIIKTHDNHLLDLVFWWEAFVIRVTFFDLFYFFTGVFECRPRMSKTWDLNKQILDIFTNLIFGCSTNWLLFIWNFFGIETRYCNNSVLVCFRVFGWNRFLGFLNF